MAHADDMVLAPAEATDADALQRLLESDPWYAERLTGYPPGPSDAQSMLLMAPEGVPLDRKVVLVGRTAGAMVAVIDIVRGYPAADRAVCGLLMVRRDRRRKGVGARALDGAVRWIEAQWPEVRALRLAVADPIAPTAEPFLRAQGFSPTGETRPYRYARVESTTRVWEVPLSGRDRTP